MPQSPRTLKILTVPSIDHARKKIEVFFFFSSSSKYQATNQSIKLQVSPNKKKKYQTISPNFSFLNSQPKKKKKLQNFV